MAQKAPRVSRVRRAAEDRVVLRRAVRRMRSRVDWDILWAVLAPWD